LFTRCFVCVSEVNETIDLMDVTNCYLEDWHLYLRQVCEFTLLGLKGPWNLWCTMINRDYRYLNISSGSYQVKFLCQNIKLAIKFFVSFSYNLLSCLLNPTTFTVIEIIWQSFNLYEVGFVEGGVKHQNFNP
jgi:hypothetical protein